MNRRDLALVTGAGTGIGRAVTLALAARGFDVVAVGRRAAPLEQLALDARDLGAHGTVLPREGDASLPHTVADILRTATEAGSLRLAVAVASAGTFTRGPVHELEPLDWDRQLTGNLTTAFHTLRAATSLMRAQELVARTRGHVFTLNSGAGVTGFPGGSGYAAAKHGLRGLVESLRGELTGTGIKITDLVVSATVESEMSAGRDVPMVPASTVAHTVTACLDLGGIATWDRVDLGQLR